jgi:hypothetical protein
MSISAVSQSFSELISEYAAQFDNSGGLSGWQWFYIIEGILGISMAIITGYQSYLKNILTNNHLDFFFPHFQKLANFSILQTEC